MSVRAVEDRLAVQAERMGTRYPISVVSTAATISVSGGFSSMDIPLKTHWDM
jgi:hypothetical protein